MTDSVQCLEWLITWKTAVAIVTTYFIQLSTVVVFVISQSLSATTNYIVLYKQCNACILYPWVLQRESVWLWSHQAQSYSILLSNYV